MARSQKEAAEKTEPEPEVEETVEEPEPQRGVFVARVLNEQGNVDMVAQPVGVEPDQVDTILALGLRGWRQRLGIDKV